MPEVLVMLSKPQLSAGDPTTRVTAVFTAIANTRMAGLPIVNPALRVEAVTFTPWENGWLGVLVTPWCMNLLWIPIREEPPLGQLGAKIRLGFPAIACEFVVCQEAELGAYLSCSLFSPMAAFIHQEEARITAITVLQTLLAPVSPSEKADRSCAGEPTTTQRRWSRRALFAKWFSDTTYNA
jgi:[NiFe] hydrogenase assembly HybE family chaperone